MAKLSASMPARAMSDVAALSYAIACMCPYKLCLECKEESQPTQIMQLVCQKVNQHVSNIF